MTPMAVPGQKVCSRCYSQLSDILKEPRAYKLSKSINSPKTILLPGKTDSNLSDTDIEIHAFGARLTQVVEYANLKIFICETLKSVFLTPSNFRSQSYIIISHRFMIVVINLFNKII